MPEYATPWPGAGAEGQLDELVCLLPCTFVGFVAQVGLDL